MLKGRGRDTRGVTSPPPGHPTMRTPGMATTTTSHPTISPGHSTIRSPGLASPGQQAMRLPGLASRPQQQRALPAKPEPDYEVVEFPSDQYVNAKLQPPPPPPPRPPTGHPAQAGASCGLCGGGGARVRCAECGRRALCASCDDMYHRHPKRRHHQRQALSLSQLGEQDRPPLPPKGTPPVPPPRRHKMSASPMPMTPMLDQRRNTLGHATMPGMRASASPTIHNQVHQPLLVQTKMVNNPNQVGSMPFLPTTMPHQHQQPMHMQQNPNTLGNLNAAWNRPRGSLQGFNVPQVQEPWDSPEGIPPSAMGQPQWGRPMRRGASTLELGGGNVACAGCAHCAPPTWRYGSCATLDQPWAVGQGWPMQQCCPPQQPPHGHFHMHQPMPQTPQAYRRADSRAMSRAASRAGSRAASPALSVRSRASRRTKHRTPSPQLPSSDADSESESESERGPKPRNEHHNSRPERPSSRSERPNSRSERTCSRSERPTSPVEEESLGPVPPPPSAPWQCEHCTYVNEPGVRVCVICCKTPTAAPKVVTEVASNFEAMKIASRSASPVPERESQRVEQVSGRTSTKSKKERTSTGCGPSPPREETSKKNGQRLVTPTREQNGSSTERQTRHDMAVGPSPPRENCSNQSTAVGPSPTRDTRAIHNSMAVGTSTPRETKPVNNSYTQNQREPSRPSPQPKVEYSNTQQKVERHSVSVGPSPPRENTRESVTGQKKFVGTSPSRDVRPESRSSSITGKTNVSNTGTSPPPQSISTQTYEDPSTYERSPSLPRSRPRRRFRDERRERSHSRHSLSSDTRESDRSVRTTGAWEWRERDSSPSVGGGEWGGKLARRASHLDLRRRDVRPARRTSLYGSEAPSPEPPSGRTISMEVLSGGRNTERGLELARLLAEAERLGYSAAEVQVGLSQSPGAPLAWLRSRWAGLAGAVQGAAARLAPGCSLSAAAARAALARHRGAVWPAVTDCVDTLRRQSAPVRVSAEGRMRGRVWGSPAGADDDAAPRRAESSDEYDAARYEHEWYAGDPSDAFEVDREIDLWSVPPPAPAPLAPLAHESADLANKLRSLLLQAGIPSIDENLLLKGLLTNAQTKLTPETIAPKSSLDFIQSENDFIDAYNALTRASPLPNISKPIKDSEVDTIGTESAAKERLIKKDDVTHLPNGKDTNKIINTVPHHHHKQKHHSPKQNIQDTNQIKANQVKTQEMQRLQIETEAAVQQNQIHSLNKEINHNTSDTKPISQTHVQLNQRNEKDLQNLPDLTNFQTIRQADEKSSNLNEIVDNTQKLIQQMKEEINSDIHSLDDGHSQTSRSDHDTSSHDEQESSYSETDDETNNMSVTSDEKEISSSSEDEHDDDIEAPRNGASNRTSSEDNEQFEEALDNLDNQIEDVKHANIEILDSIARSLQEDHTVSVEVNEPRENYLKHDHAYSMPMEANHLKENNYSHNISIVVNEPIENNLKREDSNNNIFAEVNSFEEIYAELNTSKVNQKPTPQKSTVNNIPKKSEVPESIPIKPKVRLTKYAINESVFTVVSPTRVIISDNIEPMYNAVIVNPEIQIDNSTVENATEIIHGVEDIDTNQPLQPTNINVSANTQEMFGTESVNILNNTSSTETVETIEEVTTEVDVPAATPSPTDQQIIQTVMEQQNIVDTESQNINENKSIEPNQSHNNIQRNTPEKVINPANDINTNKSSTPKSNIPKPVRTALNNKSKTDKSAPKLLVSKVPVRRGSLKQYHAPAPPKTHFGNVQSGHVKQLQSKIFNSKDKPNKPQATEMEAKPSTSTATLSKKSPAPQPPRRFDQKQISPPKISPPRDKSSNYFRETCRTEDEWTESDSDESQIVRQSSIEEVKPATPSPPPPLTLRRVSGNIIDLAAVRLPEGSPERQARMLLAEGATETWEQAHLAVELVSRGTELPTALLAALECADLPAALAYLHQDCELCASRFPEHEMVSMLRCTHRCCRECARLYFTVQITERSIADCVCPFCKMPELESLPEDAWLEYFAHLDIQLKTLLETDVHELFQRKLRDRTLAMDPNFKWCMECSSGFFVHPKQKKLRCPECRSVSCATCRKSWNSNHEGLSCEQYAAWLADNDPEISVAAVQQHLRENGLECPRCHFKYSLSRGGCMHFTCTQCKYEFCYGCGKPFTMGARCGLSEYCAKLGLHAHHPRNCLFYLRDKEPHELQTLLQMNNLTYEIEATEGSNGRCPIPLQRETPTGLVDGICGSEAPPKHAGLCKSHYVEYLAGMARALDPIPIMEVSELVAELRRRALPLPERGPWDTDPIYAGMCAEIVKEKIPLD